MQSLRQIKNRIRGIENTKKVTAAMELISVAKLNRIDKLLFNLRPYSLKLDAILNNLAASAAAFRHPLLDDRPKKGKIGLCILAADSGLCGAYNINILSLAEDFIREHGSAKVSVVAIGKKAFTYFKRRSYEILNSYMGLNGRYSQKICDEINQYLINLYLSGKVDEVHVAYTHFENAMVHKPVLKKFLNITPGEGIKSEYIFEPEKEKIFAGLIQRYVQVRFRLMLIEAFTSEHAARPVVMKQATDNAEDLLHNLNLVKNKVRQANITQDIMEIISSAEALKG